MTSNDLVGYVEDAIHRVSADMVLSQNGSHAAGVFNKAANGFEKHIAAVTAAATRRFDLDKMTLGALIQLLEKLPSANLEPWLTIIGGARQVNDPWKRIKHGDDPPVAELLQGLQAMRDVLIKLP